MLLLWSSGDRRVRVEVGYGLEGVLPDGKAGAILDTYVMPKFKSGEFDEGLLAGVDALLRAARDEPVELPSSRSQSYKPQSRGVYRGRARLAGQECRSAWAQSSASGGGAATAGAAARRVRC